MSESLEQGNVGQGGEQAARQDDLHAADPVRECAKDQEEGGREEERDPDQDVGREVVELQGDREKEQGIELARVPDDPLASGGSQKGEEHVLVVRIS